MLSKLLYLSYKTRVDQDSLQVSLGKQDRSFNTAILANKQFTSFVLN